MGKEPVIATRKPPNPLRTDPTRTITLRRALVAKVRRGFAKLKARLQALVRDENSFALTTNTRWQFATDSAKVQAFQSWLKSQVAEVVAGKTEEQMWEQYAKAAMVKGSGRSFDDVNARAEAGAFGDADKLAFYSGTKRQFLDDSFRQPVAVDKLKTLAERSFTDLKNVTDDMATKMRRTLVDGLARGLNPREMAGDLAAILDSSRSRAETVARTEIIRAHAEGQLLALERAGVDEVGVQVEWSTAGDDRVCPLCEDMEGTIYTIEEAHGLIPKHPNCRCAFLPYFPEVGLEGERPTAKDAATPRERCDQVVEDAKARQETDLDVLDLQHSDEADEIAAGLAEARQRVELEQSVIDDLQEQLAGAEDDNEIADLQSRLDDAREQQAAASAEADDLEQQSQDLPARQADERQALVDQQKDELDQLQQRCDEVAEMANRS